MISDQLGHDGLKDCFRVPIPEIFEAALLLDSGVTAHLEGDIEAADEAIRAADMPVIGEWLDSIWLGRNEPYRRVQSIEGLPPVLTKADRFQPRDAPPDMKRALVARDGHHCRLCGIPLVRPEVRKMLTKHYPTAARWTGIRHTEQHRGLQVMWLQYDHVVVHSRGGETTMDNIVVTCAACNFGRDRFMMAEVALRDPRSHPRSPTWAGWRAWDGLERILRLAERYVFQPDTGEAAEQKR
jgi:5-methylcytosine-specific restriction endonuclease McrA